VVTEVAPALCATARERTTALAATLLRHASRGEVDDASEALLRALCRRGDAGTALDRLLAVGHSSGTGLATGILLSAACAGGAP
jgi:acetyl esterase/lipase